MGGNRLIGISLIGDFQKSDKSGLIYSDRRLSLLTKALLSPGAFTSHLKVLSASSCYVLDTLSGGSGDVLCTFPSSVPSVGHSD